MNSIKLAKQLISGNYNYLTKVEIAALARTIVEAEKILSEIKEWGNVTTTQDYDIEQWTVRNGTDS